MIVLTNDDGIDAPGIRALLAGVNSLTFGRTPGEVREDSNLSNNKPGQKPDEKIIIAPRDPHSGCGHQVTTKFPIQVQQLSPGEYAIAGTPADCTRIAIHHLCSQISWVLSGINSGGNLGVDVYISGTVAAVREAAFHGIPGIAISQYRAGGKPVNWERARDLTAQVLFTLLQRPLEPGHFWNVNLPYLELEAPEPDFIFCQPSTQPLPLDYQIEGDALSYIGNYSQRQRQPGTDVEVCFGGDVAITLLKL
ncbi:MAG: 5'/3'-nucleotidase SurE [Oscillatoriales cyanobacterium RM1_1_9]|nr:5'/3'-nucleotidase SurE [Oscillatoriales cyanobacterium SM2_3_0]NJO44156.1 5'/3'-nucleotidase SurE [Oscillatoriales cyanobacterium RM2_1_1]NJO70917.1 5'/3'-nucleotidase SurE [Oscillatoriales cyanobacterium RM1_1_9]